jgi:hypothetical protein
MSRAPTQVEMEAAAFLQAAINKLPMLDMTWPTEIREQWWKIAGGLMDAAIRLEKAKYQVLIIEEDLSMEPILQFFTWEHLPADLQAVSKPFCEMARQLVEMLPRNPERTVALRKLLEAKDAAVRAKVCTDQRPS